MSNIHLYEHFLVGILALGLLITAIRAASLLNRNRQLTSELEEARVKMQRTDRRSLALILDAEENLKRQTHHNEELQAAIAQAELLEEVVINANDGIMITRADHINRPGPEIVYVNDALCKITGYSKEELIGQSPRMLQGEKSDRKTLNAIRCALEKGEPYRGEVINYNKAGEPYWLSISLVPVRNKAGDVTHFAAIERDITEDKAAEKELKEAVEHAETANRAKSEFLANMSHELRTPMNGVLGMCNLLLDTKLDEEQKELTGTIAKSSDDLLVLLNDILDISKVESGDVSIERVAFDIYREMRGMVRLYEAAAQNKSLQLVLNIDDNVPCSIMGDYVKLQQIMRNLVGNAIKFTEEGTITINIAVVEDQFDETTGPEIYFYVRDTGIGIPEDRLEDIFNKFTQADASTTRKYGGTGLGLAITRELVLLMGGRIGVESKIGSGSIFYFCLPLEIPPEGAIPVNIETGNEGGHMREDHEIYSNAAILLVDDHPVNRLFANKLLKKIGYGNVTIAEDGAQALEMLETKDFALVLMDCQMPEIDGYEATRQLRLREAGQAVQTPVIALTANAMVGDKQKCLAAGMNDYLSKPLDREKLDQMLLKWLSSASTAKKKEAEVNIVEETVTGSPIDMEHLEVFTDGDPEEEREVFELFLEQAKLNLEDLKSTANLEDSEPWRKAAHKFKGSAANLGAFALADACKEAEHQHTQPQTQRLALLTTIEAQYGMVETFMVKRMA